MSNLLLPCYKIPDESAVGHEAEHDDDDDWTERWSAPDVEWHYGAGGELELPDTEEDAEENGQYKKGDLVRRGPADSRSLTDAEGNISFCFGS